MEENYEEQSKVFHLNRAGAANRYARRIRFRRIGQKPAQIQGLGPLRPLGPLRHVQQIWPMLPGSVSGPGRVPGSGSCDFVSVSGPGRVSGSGSGRVSGSSACYHVPGSGSGACCHVPGSGACYHVPGSGSGPGYHVPDSGSSSCYHVPAMPVETLRRGEGFQKHRFTATSNWGETVTQRLIVGSPYVIEPDALAGAGLANNKLLR
jgi:hypothetical protein